MSVLISDRRAENYQGEPEGKTGFLELTGRIAYADKMRATEFDASPRSVDVPENESRTLPGASLNMYRSERQLEENFKASRPAFRRQTVTREKTAWSRYGILSIDKSNPLTNTGPWTNSDKQTHSDLGSQDRNRGFQCRKHTKTMPKGRSDC